MKKWRILSLLMAASFLSSCACSGGGDEIHENPAFETAASSDLVLYFNEEFNGYFVADYKGKLPYVRIPDTATGDEGEAEVVGIGDNAFFKRTDLKGISLGKNVHYLGEYAFEDSGIEYLYVNDNLTNISDEAFVGSNIKKNRKNSVLYLPGEDFPYKFAVGFATGESRPDIVLEEGCVGVLGGAFDGLYATVTLPSSSLRYIGEHGATAERITFTSGELSLLYCETTTVNIVNKITFLPGARGFTCQLSVPTIRMARDIKEVGTISGKGDVAFLGTPDEWKLVKGGNKALIGDTKLKFLEGVTLSLGKDDIGDWSDLKNYEGIEYVEYTDDVASFMNLSKRPKTLLTHIAAIKDEKLVIPEGTKKIPDGAFSYVANFTEVEIPTSVTEIDDFAFYGCPNLKKVTLPSSVKAIGYRAFANSPSLAQVDGGESVTSIENGAFYHCAALASFSFPKHCFGITSATFEGTALPKTEKGGLSYYGSASSPYYFLAGLSDESVTSFTVEEGCECTGNSLTLEKAVSISFPSSLRGLGTIYGSKALKSVDIKAPLESFGGFWYCSSLHLDAVEIDQDALYVNGCTEPTTSVGSVNYRGDAASFLNIEKGEKFIPWHLYLDGGEETTKVVLPQGITEIPSRCFAGCQSVTSISFPASLQDIAEDAFLDCPKLVGTTKDKITYIGDASRPYLYLMDGKKASGEVAIEAGCVSMAKEAFASSSITGVTFPSSLRNIASYAFKGCASLKKIDLPGTLSSVGDYAFRSCSAAKEIRVGFGIENIGSNPFYLCKSATKLAIGSFAQRKKNDGWGCIDYLFGYLIMGTNDMAPLKEVEIVEGVETLDEEFGIYVPVLDKVTLPASLKSSFFFSVYRVKSLAVASGSPYLSTTSQGIIHTADSLIFVPGDISGEVSIPQGITEIPGGAFYERKNVSSILVPDSVKSIGDKAFGKCSLTSITLPEGLERIEDYAFENSSLTAVVLPSTLTYVGDYSLGSVKDVTIYPTGSGLIGMNRPFYDQHAGYGLEIVRFRGTPKEWGRVWRKLFNAHHTVIYVKQDQVIFES